MPLNQQQIEHNKQEFIALLSSVERQGIDRLISWLTDQTDFFIAPSSTVFHGNYTGGLCEHSLNVYKAIVRLLNMSDLMLSSRNIDGINNENLIIVALLHDLCKVNYYVPEIKSWKDESESFGNQWKKYYTYKTDDQFPIGHGEKSVIRIQQFIKLTLDEMLAIRWHMGPYDPAVHVSIYERPAFNKAMSQSALLVLLSLADTFAAQLMEQAVNPKTDCPANL